MKKISLEFSLLALCLLFYFGCSNDSEDAQTDTPISTDISVTASENLITWTDIDNLNQQLQDVISFNYGTASQNEVNTSIAINSNNTLATATISFKPEFQNSYTDANLTNNIASVALQMQATGTNAVVLNADGPGNTYELITSVLAPGFDPVEVPDCNHSSFGRHIDEVFDNELNTNVFRFIIHTTPDNDRCINFDRQRNEIKSYNQSPDNLLGVQNETVVYKWRFKLPAGFQSSPNFTHLHQLKSVGGSLESMPMYTLTTRKSNTDRLELRYAETDTQITLKQTPLAPLIDVWLDVTETIEYSPNGTYNLEIKRVSDGVVLFEHSENTIVNWRPGGSFVRPKWGIYRSLINNQDLRDEMVLYANFSIEEL